MTLVTVNDLTLLNPRNQTYAARREGNGEGSFQGFLYPVGEGWTGRETGQRTILFADDFPSPSASVLIPREDLYPTESSVLRNLTQETWGFPELPSWIDGSGKSYQLSGSSIRLPDTSSWRTFQRLSRIGDAYTLVASAGLSQAPGFDLETGPAAPRTHNLFWMGMTPEIEGTLLCGSTPIRQSSSYWDFSTAIDPVWIKIDQDQGTLFRNLTALISQTISFPSEGLPFEAYGISFPDGVLEDDYVGALWAGADSLSDTEFIPSIQTTAPLIPGFDLSGRLLGSFDPPQVLISIPQDEKILRGASGTWTQTRYPLNLTPSGSGETQLLFHSNLSGGVPISTRQGSLLGMATPIDGQNGWSRSGSLINLPRKQGESDLRYGGRQQRLWTQGLLDYLSGSVPRCVRALSAALGLTAFREVWRGEDLDIPSDTSGLDLLTPDSLPIQLTLTGKDLVLLSSLSGIDSAASRTDLQNGKFYQGLDSETKSRGFYCREDLTAFAVRIVLKDGVVLLPGRDYVLSAADPRILILRKALSPESQLEIVLDRRLRIKVQLDSSYDMSSLTSVWTTGRASESLLSESLSSPYCELAIGSQQPLRESRTQIAKSSRTQEFHPVKILANRIPGDVYAPLMITRGVFAGGASRLKRRLYQPDEVSPTLLGKAILGSTDSRSLWSTPLFYGSPAVGVPTDTEL